MMGRWAWRPQLFGATLLAPAVFCPNHLKKSFEIRSILKTPKKKIIFLDLKLVMYYRNNLTWHLCTNSMVEALLPNPAQLLPPNNCK